MPDWRIFSIMDGAGNVAAGTSSFLVRAAKPFSLSTNTSQGASYAIGVVLGEPSTKPVDLQKSVLPLVPRQYNVGASRRTDLREFLKKLDDVTDRADPLSEKGLDRDGTATLLADFHRNIFDILGREHSPLMSIARGYDQGRIGRGELYGALLSARVRLFEADRFTANVEAQVREHLAKWSPKEREPKAVDRRSRLSKLTIEDIEPQLVRESLVGKSMIYKLEVGRYVDAPHPFIRKVLSELKAAGGEMRRVRDNETRDGSGSWMNAPAGAEFRVDDRGRPIIDIDLLQDYAIAGLAHEREHFLSFEKWKTSLIAEGLPPIPDPSGASSRQEDQRDQAPRRRRDGRTDCRDDHGGLRPFGVESRDTHASATTGRSGLHQTSDLPRSGRGARPAPPGAVDDGSARRGLRARAARKSRQEGERAPARRHRAAPRTSTSDERVRVIEDAGRGIHAA
jgi:hypothetical protein